MIQVINVVESLLCNSHRLRNGTKVTEMALKLVKAE